MTNEQMTSTSTTTNEHLTEIRRTMEISVIVGGATQHTHDRVMEHAAAMAETIDRYDIALRAAASFIELLEQGKGPSDPAYLPLRDCYRNAVEDPADFPADPPTPSTPRGAQS